MKKVLAIVGVLAAATSISLAAASAQITLSATFSRDYFYQNVGLTTPTAAGWYVEVILSSAQSAYVHANYDSYIVIGEDFGTYYSGGPYHETGKLASGSATSSGRSSVSWTFSTTTYDNYYATFRFYNNSVKASATSYGVLPTWKQVTLDPADPAPAQQSLGFTTTADRGYIAYSLTPVPEPTTMALFGLGGLALVIRRKMRKDA
jgi:hypothetical protein